MISLILESKETQLLDKEIRFGVTKRQERRSWVKLVRDTNFQTRYTVLVAGRTSLGNDRRLWVLTELTVVVSLQYM